WVLLTRFQAASTERMVTLNAVPAAWAEGVPVLPVALPGAAVSPGTSNCNLTNAPTFTVIEGLVLAVLVPSVMSVAVTVQLPAVLLVMLKVPDPAANAALAGKTSLGSAQAIPTVCVLVFTKFQLASTARTVTLYPMAAV